MINKASALAGVTWNVLLANFMGWTAYPIDSLLTVVAVDIWVDVFAGWEALNLVFVS